MKAARDALKYVFHEVDLLRWSAEFIVSHSTNKQDIRDVALAGLGLENCRKILDLGCAFGFSTRALKDRVHSLAGIVGIDRYYGYRETYLRSARSAGLSGEFHAEDVRVLKNFDACCFDLVICSFALYFFPQAISDIARIIKPDGYFITITHCDGHMRELVDLVKGCLPSMGNSLDEDLPIEKLIQSFSNLNGRKLLSRWFGDVRETRYSNSLEITKQEIDSLTRYFRFKQSFFIPPRYLGGKRIRSCIESCLSRKVMEEGPLLLSKNDTVFVCRRPKHRSLGGE